MAYENVLGDFESLRVWMLSFECSGVVKVGGLGEVPINQARELVKKGFDVSLVMPSHGAVKNSDLVENLGLRRIEGSFVEKFPAWILKKGRREEMVEIGAFEGVMDGVKVVLLSGLDYFAGGYLEDPLVYGPDVLLGKLALYAKGLRWFASKSFQGGVNPDVIHAHDHHTFPAALCARQELEASGENVALVSHFHLLTFPRVDWDFLASGCGVEDKVMSFQLDTIVKVSPKELLRRADSNLESFGGLISDVFVTVSRGYLESDILPIVGRSYDLKSDYVWNGCDWEVSKLREDVFRRHDGKIREFLGIKAIKAERWDLRKYLLTKALGEMPENEPILKGEEVIKAVYDLKGEPYTAKGRVTAFKEDGPLVLMTGRMSAQKGIETVFDAIPKVLDFIPNAKFLFLLLPTEYELDLVTKFGEKCKEFKENSRLVCGVAPSLYFLAHLSADCMAAPSKWEPFGIFALEGMLCGVTIAAAEIGGLKETVIDIRKDPENGTGMKVPVDDSNALAEAFITLLTLLQINENMEKTGQKPPQSTISTMTLSFEEMLDLIPETKVRELVKKEPSYGKKVRENCFNRVESNFRWHQVVDQLINVYKKAKETETKREII